MNHSRNENEEKKNESSFAFANSKLFCHCFLSPTNNTLRGEKAKIYPRKKKKWWMMSLKFKIVYNLLTIERVCHYGGGKENFKNLWMLPVPTSLQKEEQKVQGLLARSAKSTLR